MIICWISITRGVSRRFALFVEIGYLEEDITVTLVESVLLNTIITAHGSTIVLVRAIQADSSSSSLCQYSHLPLSACLLFWPLFVSSLMTNINSNSILYSDSGTTINSKKYAFYFVFVPTQLPLSSSDLSSYYVQSKSEIY